MWVASYIQAIQVTEESRRVSQVIINVPTSYLAQRDGGRRKAAIIKTRVDVREACISREEVSVARPKGHSALGSGQPIKSLSHMPLVRKGIIRPAVRKLASTQGRDPHTHAEAFTRQGKMGVFIVPLHPLALASVRQRGVRVCEKVCGS